MAKNILILITFVLVVFSPCLKADFINLDDDGHIYKNPALQTLSLGSIKQIFTQTLNKTYIPLTILSFAIEKYFFGFNPFVFHLDNLLIYTVDIVLVLFLARRLGLSIEASFLAALIFAIHPMKVESVAWAVERKDVLYALFYLLALHQYWSYLRKSSVKNYIGTIFLGFLSILAKPMALSLPLILLVFDWFYGRKLSKGVLIEKIPALFYAIGIAWISYALNMRNPVGHIFPQGILIWIFSLSFYFWKFLFPFQLCPYYVLPQPISIFHWPYLLSVVFFISLILLLVRFHRHKLFIFAFLYFFISIFFLLRFDQEDFSVLSDRFMFLPSLGICFFIGAWLDGSIRTKWGTIVLYLILVMMGIKTCLQCQVWHDSLSFWNEIIQENPGYYLAYNNRALFFYGHLRYDLALKDCNKAIALNPKAAKVYANRGLIYSMTGQDRRALDDFGQAISLEPSFPESYINRSVLRERLKDYTPALKDALMAKKLGGHVGDDYLKLLQDKIKSTETS